MEPKVSIDPFGAVPDRSHFALVSLDELLRREIPKTRFLVDELLLVGGTSILVAKPKIGKSTLAQQLAAAVASGSPFLSRSVQQGTVLYFAFEERDTEVARTFRLAEIDPRLSIWLHFGEPPEMREDAPRDVIALYNPSLIIVDTLAYWARVTDYNDYGEVASALRPLHTIARATNTHILVVHHAGKGDRASSIDSALGSTALTGSVDTILVLAEGSDETRFLETKQRYGDSLPKTILTFDKATRQMGIGDTFAAKKVRDLEDEALTLLADEQMTEDSLAKTLCCNHKDLSSALKRFMATGRVVRSGTGKRGNAYTYAFKGPSGNNVDLDTENHLDTMPS